MKVELSASAVPRILDWLLALLCIGAALEIILVAFGGS